MRSDQQFDLYQHSPQRLAQAWRAAAETARRQFPHDTARHAHYDNEADRIEREAGEIRK